jgi:hypothetical protein
MNMERRQTGRRSIGMDQELRVSLFLDSYSLLHEGRNEEFELAGAATDISLMGLGMQLNVVTDLITLRPNREVKVRLSGRHRDEVLAARVAHFEKDEGTLGLQFYQPLQLRL